MCLQQIFQRSDAPLILFGVVPGCPCINDTMTILLILKATINQLILQDPFMV